MFVLHVFGAARDSRVPAARESDAFESGYDGSGRRGTCTRRSGVAHRTLARPAEIHDYVSGRIPRFSGAQGLQNLFETSGASDQIVWLQQFLANLVSQISQGDPIHFLIEFR